MRNVINKLLSNDKKIFIVHNGHQDIRAFQKELDAKIFIKDVISLKLWTSNIVGYCIFLPTHIDTSEISEIIETYITKDLQKIFVRANQQEIYPNYFKQKMSFFEFLVNETNIVTNLFQYTDDELEIKEITLH